ncbi:Tetrapyrrole-binding protein, chloroplastic [Tetrabaena socialis]|uniref:Tetrapyrrole-binding protein, chloroplastic n=1 Tax=Tetrabaena socialis TaxID=47790 RepID=A0A2J7ZW69_9CHLO|nr:Tetrapyrrole-binding protein, chloroplastic [Tetrabaena socialis]|eukprot:PNH04496.1 Tetrapyrrole-binding protein, chloroplastic [Tetrabaena socialis]
MQAHLQAPARGGCGGCRSRSQQTSRRALVLPSHSSSWRSAAPASQPQPSRSVGVLAGLDSVSLFGDSTSSLLGGGAPAAEKKVSPKEAIMAVALQSEVGMDYAPLRDALLEGDFRKAEDETRALLIKLSGEGAMKRNWVYFTEVKTISVADFQTVDNLWKASSNGKFGYSVQKEIWVQAQRRWPKFFKQIDWVQGENNNYRKWPMEFTYSSDAVKGHLPLTNALRGTQLFQAIMEHPAFEAKAKKGMDERAREAASGTVKLF